MSQKHGFRIQYDLLCAAALVGLSSHLATVSRSFGVHRANGCGNAGKHRAWRSVRDVGTDEHCCGRQAWQVLRTRDDLGQRSAEEISARHTGSQGEQMTTYLVLAAELDVHFHCNVGTVLMESSVSMSVCLAHIRARGGILTCGCPRSLNAFLALTTWDGTGLASNRAQTRLI